MNSPAVAPLRAALERPGVFDVGAPEQVIETHISWLFFVGDRVFKVKKPLSLPFLDYSTLALRKHFCEEEVRLGRRFAGSVYRGVAEITRCAEGDLRVRRANDPAGGEVVDYAVEMERLPARHLLDRKLEEGCVDNSLIERVVDRLVGFDASAARSPEISRFGRAEELRGSMLRNLEEFSESATGAVLSTARARFLRERFEAFFSTHRALLERRVEEGRIREGHGDLHAGNLCDLGDRIVAYDCIDFEPRFRCLDSAAEIAFLAMDIEARGFPAFAQWLVHRAAVRYSDPELATLVPLYTVHYALVRAKVALLRGHDPAAHAEAVAYVDLSTVHAFGPILVLTAGLPGSGKSTFALAIARYARLGVLRSDVVRKELAGMQASERCREGDLAGIYSVAASDALYCELLARAKSLLERGHGVLVDAAFSSVERRAPFLALARSLAIACFCAHVTAPEHVIEERLRQRALDPHEPSDADLAVYRAARSRFEPPNEFGWRAIEVDSTAPEGEVLHIFLEAAARPSS